MYYFRQGCVLIFAGDSHPVPPRSVLRVGGYPGVGWGQVSLSTHPYLSTYKADYIHPTLGSLLAESRHPYTEVSIRLRYT